MGSEEEPASSSAAPLRGSSSADLPSIQSDAWRRPVALACERRRLGSTRLHGGQIKAVPEQEGCGDRREYRRYEDEVAGIRVEEGGLRWVSHTRPTTRARAASYTLGIELSSLVSRFNQKEGRSLFIGGGRYYRAPN